MMQENQKSKIYNKVIYREISGVERRSWGQYWTISKVVGNMDEGGKGVWVPRSHRDKHIGECVCPIRIQFVESLKMIRRYKLFFRGRFP